jgi:opacity protein-like surface antigen
MNAQSLVLRVCCLALVVFTATAAQAGGCLSIGPMGGVTFPVDDFTDLAKTGFAAGATADYLVQPNFALGLTALYNPYGKQDKNYWLKATVSIVQITTHGKFYLNTGSKISLFVVGGGGLYIESADTEGSSYDGYGGTESWSDSGSSTEFGVHAGFGAQLHESKTVDLALQAGYNMIFDKDEEYKGTRFMAATVAILYTPGRN